MSECYSFTSTSENAKDASSSPESPGAQNCNASSPQLHSSKVIGGGCSQRKVQTKVLFQLPNGFSLKFAMPWDFGNQATWYKDQDNSFIRNWEPGEKRRNAKLGLWSSKSNQNLISADFDQLPPNHNSFDELFLTLQDKYKDGIHFRTFSNKCKILFLVESEAPISKGLAVAFLRHRLQGDDFTAIDKSWSALSISYLNPNMINIINNKLPISPINYFNYESPQTGGGGCTSCTKIARDLKRHEGVVDESFARFIHNNKNKEDFLRILICTRALVEEGFDIPSTLFAKQCKTTQQNISNWIKQLIRYGELKCIKEKYIPGKKAKRYIAVGALGEFIQLSAPKRLIKLPKTIEDGKWEQTIWYVSYRLYKKPDEFERWLKSVQGWDQKPDRIKHVKKVIKQRIKYEKMNNNKK